MQKKESSYAKLPNRLFIPIARSAIDETEVFPNMRAEINRRIKELRELAKSNKPLTEEQLSLMLSDAQEPGF
jgi:hypothetical protein